MQHARNQAHTAKDAIQTISMPLFGQALTERLFTPPGLAPDIPEDLYMLIKKVRQNTPSPSAPLSLLFSPPPPARVY